MKRIITVTLTAIQDGDTVRILDAHGKRVASMPASAAVVADAATVRSLQLRLDWADAFAGMIGGLNSKKQHLTKTGWQRKIDVWRASLRWRRNRHLPPSKSPSRKYSHEVRPTWQHAVNALLCQYNSRLHETRLRKNNPWRLWTQTASGNHRKRRAIINERKQEKAWQSVSDGSRLGSTTGTTEFQMQLHWSGADASAVVA